MKLRRLPKHRLHQPKGCRVSVPNRRSRAEHASTELGHLIQWDKATDVVLASRPDYGRCCRCGAKVILDNWSNRMDGGAVLETCPHQKVAQREMAR